MHHRSNICSKHDKWSLPNYLNCFERPLYSTSHDLYATVTPSRKTLSCESHARNFSQIWVGCRCLVAVMGSMWLLWVCFLFFRCCCCCCCKTALHGSYETDLLERVTVALEAPTCILSFCPLSWTYKFNQISLSEIFKGPIMYHKFFITSKTRMQTGKLSADSDMYNFLNLIS